MATAAALLARGGGALLLPSFRLRICPAATKRSSSIPTRLCHHNLRNFSSFHLSPTTTSSQLFHVHGRRPRYLCCVPQSEQNVATEETAATTSPESPPHPPPTPEEVARAAASGLDIRVGCILRAWRHPEADSLYVEEVDVGEPEPRTICSGLVNYIPLEHLEGKHVIVLANLKPRNMRGVKSNGMLMAASDASHETVELLVPPEGSAPGERIWFGSEEEKSEQPDAVTPNQVQKKKIWESVQPHLKTTETCEAVLLSVHPMRTSAGVVTCGSLKNANIS